MTRNTCYVLLVFMYLLHLIPKTHHVMRAGDFWYSTSQCQCTIFLPLIKGLYDITQVIQLQ